MPLSEKILALRTGLDLSQEALAEQLAVSRQSVSKWETGQSVPDLDKIIKMADLFGVTVDALVRDETQAQPSHPEPPQLIYVEKSVPARSQSAWTMGVLFAVLGCLLLLLALLLSPGLLLPALALIILSLPLLLARRHPWLLFGWVVFLLLIILTDPSLTGYFLRFRWPWDAIRIFLLIITRRGGSFSSLIAALISLMLTILLFLLLFFTWKAWTKRSSNVKAQRNP